MSTRASAARYARALLDVVVKEGDPEQVEQELTAFADLFAGSADLRRAVTNPVVPVRAKRGIVEDLLSSLRPAPPLAKLLLLLAERNRLSLVGDVAAVYRARLLEHRRIVRAEVRTAAPLSEERLGAFQRRLADATGRRVELTARVDPSLIGGAVARIGSTVYDGSVASRLARLRERLQQSS